MEGNLDVKIQEGIIGHEVQRQYKKGSLDMRFPDNIIRNTIGKAIKPEDKLKLKTCPRYIRISFEVGSTALISIVGYQINFHTN